MANTEKQKTFDNIKNVKRNVLDVARELQQRLSAVKAQASSLTAGIKMRAAEFAAMEEVIEEEAALQNTVEVTEQQTAVADVPPVAEAEKEPVDAERHEEEKSDVKPKKETPAPTPAAKTDKPQQKPAAAPQPKPTPTVVTTVDKDGVKTKTYTDEKGNVKVRRFLDPGAASSRAQKPAPKDKNGAQAGSNRAQGASRPQGGGTAQNGRNNAKRSFAPVEIPTSAPQKNFGNKNKTKEHPEEKRMQSKKSLLTRDYSADYDEDRIVRRARTKKNDASHKVVAQKITNAVVNVQDVPIKMLSEKIGVPVAEIISQLFKEGIMKTINDTLDFDYAAYIASLHEVTLELKMDKTAEEIITGAEEDDGLVNDTKRPPIVTVMGHVDHGKTSLLDAIRNTNVTSGEAGGITQHIGAYTVTAKGEQITFIDTPGHAAFTAMRARGAKITDVAIIVVAADDGVMPQTIEAINHAKAAGVSIIVAINKMDKPNVDPDRVKQQLTEYELLAEEWGGDTIMVPVSAKTGMGLDKLLESVLLVTEIKELKANPKKRASGTVLEAKLDKGRGPVATVLVANGTLNVGDSLIAGAATGKIRAMFDDKGRKVKSAGPSMPVEVLGFSEVPQAGDYMYVADEKLVKKAAEERKNKIKLENARQTPSMNLGDLFGRISEGQLKNLNLIIKTDVQGSLEALKGSLEKISNDEVKVSAIHGGVGGINETDVMLAKASDAIIIGFNVRADSNAKSVAESEGVDIRLYNVIYDAVDDVTAAMKGMLAPKYKESVSGTAEVREVFKITGVGAVAGCYVTNGKVLRNSKVRIYRNDISVYDGNILALKRFKDDVKEVAAGYECGISIENYNDIKVGDVFEIYQMEEIAQ